MAKQLVLREPHLSRKAQSDTLLMDSCVHRLPLETMQLQGSLSSDAWGAEGAARAVRAVHMVHQGTCVWPHP